MRLQDQALEPNPFQPQGIIDSLLGRIPEENSKAAKRSLLTMGTEVNPGISRRERRDMIRMGLRRQRTSKYVWGRTAVTYIKVHTLPFWNLRGDQRRYHWTAVWTEVDRDHPQAGLPHPPTSPHAEVTAAPKSVWRPQSEKYSLNMLGLIKHVRLFVLPVCTYL